VTTLPYLADPHAPPRPGWRRLVGQGDLTDVPWVGLCALVGNTAIPLDGGDAETEAAAMRALGHRAARWTVLRARGVLGLATLLSFESDPLACERILDVSFMREASMRLDSDDLSVAVPRRGVLVARSADTTDHAEWEAFVAWVDELHRVAGEERLTPLLFGVRKGEVVGVMEVPHTSETTWRREPVGAATHDPRVSRVVVTDHATGTHALHVMVACTDVGEVRRAVTAALHRFLPQMRADDDFGGEIRFLVLADFLPDTPEVTAAMATLRNDLLTEADALSVPGRPLTVALDWRPRSR
jgi:hypothetical protein